MQHRGLGSRNCYKNWMLHFTEGRFDNFKATFGEFNLGCLHPVARVISYDMGFNPSTQR
jgi:hypothetical protein